MNSAPRPLLRHPMLPPALIAIAVIVSFAPALSAGFTNWDDNINFVNNPFYRGLSWPNLRWMFTTFLMGHYQPLTWLTLGADYTIWGMDPFGYHLTSVLIHAANGVLLYFALRAVLRIVGSPAALWPAVVGALAYAIHPLRVESVAWVTERRDVLCGFFTLLSVLFYLKRAEEQRDGREGTRWLVFSLIAFAAALLSKALAVMLPAVLLILDIYPLRRFVAGGRVRALLEKAPYGLLSCADAIVMLFAMRHISAVRSLETYNLLERVAQASYGLCHYVLKMVWPSGLIPLYRLETPVNPGAAKYVLAMIALAGVTGLLVVLRRRAPAGLAAWLSYVLMVFPVLGVVVTGKQLAADRYTYLALIPAAMLIAGLLDRASRSESVPRGALMAGAGAVLVALSAMTFRQSGYWKDSLTLWSRQIAIDPECETAYLDRGQARADLGDAAGAMDDCTRCLVLNPRFYLAYNLRGFLRQKQGDRSGARADYDRALEIKPDHVLALINRGDLRQSQGDLQGALDDAGSALRLDSSAGLAYSLRAGVLLKLGRAQEALADYDRAVMLRPDSPVELVGRGQTRLRLGDRSGASEDLARALRLAPPTWPLRPEVESLLLRMGHH